jgi:hypothetical protein
MSFIVVTGADAGYFPLVQELLASLADAFPGETVATGVLDGGLAVEQVAWLRGKGVAVAAPPVPEDAARAVRKRPALAVNLGKPWLDQCFPGHRTIVWLDADAWVQDAQAVRDFVAAAAHGALAIVPGTGRCWPRVTDMRWWLGGLGELRSFNYKNGRNAGLSLAVCRDIGVRPLLNAGAWALRADAPHWEAMRAWQARILRPRWLGRGKPFTSDQLAMALATYVDGHKLELLGDWCNYIAPFRIDPAKRELVEFYYPYRRVGIVHMAAKNDMRRDTSATMPVPGTDGATYHVNLRYGVLQRMLAGSAAG